MKNPFITGDKKFYSKLVHQEEIAAFESGVVHQLYSTFYLAKDAEWSTRLFVLEMKEDDEEGIGTFIEIKHLSPALINSKVDFIASIDEIKGHEIICSFEARVDKRLIATGRTGQKILKKERLNKLVNELNNQA
ncbi:MAG: thioesterase family protein [Chitinophagales bacterium]